MADPFAALRATLVADDTPRKKPSTSPDAGDVFGERIKSAQAVQATFAPTETAPEPVPEYDQPQTAVGVAEAEVADKKVAEARNAAIYGESPPAPKEGAQTAAERAALMEEVSGNLAHREQTASAPLIDSDKSVAGNVGTLFHKGVSAQERASRWAVQTSNLVLPEGGSLNVPGMTSAQLLDAQRNATDKVINSFLNDVAVDGIDPDWVHLDKSPGGNYIGVNVRKTRTVINDAKVKELLAELPDTASAQAIQGVKDKALKYAEDQVARVQATAGGRNFPLIDRSGEDITKWILQQPAGVRPFLTGLYPENATITIGDEQFQQDMFQNTVFGGLGALFELISPAAKPFAAGADSGNTLDSDALRDMLGVGVNAREELPALLGPMTRVLGAGVTADMLVSGLETVAENVPEFDTGLPFGVSTRQEIDAMRRGEANIVSQFGGLGGAAGEYALSPADETTGAVGSAVKAYSQTAVGASATLNPLHRVMRGRGWTDSQLLGIVITIPAIVLEPDATILLGPVKPLAAAAKTAKATRRVEKVTRNVDEVTEAVELATDVRSIDYKSIGRALESSTGVASGDIVERLVNTRAAELMANDPAVLKFLLANEKKVEEAAKAVAAAKGATKAAETPRLKHLAEYELKVAEVEAAQAQAQLIADRLSILETVAGEVPAGTVEAAQTARKKAVSTVLRTEAALNKLVAAHGDKIEKIKDMAKHRDEMAEARDALRANAKSAIDSAAEDVKAATAALRARGIVPPKSAVATQALSTVHTSKEALAEIRALQTARRQLSSLRKHYAPLHKAAEARLTAAQDALTPLGDLAIIIDRQAALRKALIVATNEAAKQTGAVQAATQAKALKLLRKLAKTAKLAEDRAAAALPEMRKQLKIATDEALDAKDGAPLAAREFMDKIPEKRRFFGEDVKGEFKDLHFNATKQATLELLEGAKAGIRASVTKSPDIDTGAIDDLVARSSRFQPSGARKFDPDKFREALDEIDPSERWVELDPNHVNVIARALGGEELIGDSVAALKRAMTKAQEVSAVGKRTPAQDRGKLFWAAVGELERPLHGPLIWRKAAKFMRDTVTKFKQTGRLGEMRPKFAVIATAVQQTAKQMQLELYMIARDEGLPGMLRYLDSNAPIAMRFGRTIANQGDSTIYSQFMARMREIGDSADNGVASDVLFEANDLIAVSRSYLPDMVKWSDDNARDISQLILSSILKSPPRTAKALYNRIPGIIADDVAAHLNISREEALRQILATRNRQGHYQSFVGGIVEGAMMHRVNEELLGVVLGKFEPEDIDAARRLVAGEQLTGSTMDTAVRVLNEMEITLSPGTPKAEGYGDLVKKLAILSSSKGGTAFAPKAVLDEISTSMNTMVKELDAVNKGNMAVVGGGLRAALRAVQIGMVRGYIVPRFRRFASIPIQTAAQVWANEGALVAAQTVIRAAPSSISWIPPYAAVKLAKRARAKLSESLGGHPVLPGFFESMNSPYNGRIFAGEEGTVRYGDREYSFSELRQMAIDRKVLEGTLRGELGPQFARIKGKLTSRTLPDGTEVGPERFSAGWFKKWILDQPTRQWDINNDMLTDAIETFEQRQRMELFLILLEKGLSPDAAAERTIKALWDWSSPVTLFEMNLIVGKIPFYRVFRNSGQHAFEMLTEVFTAPTDDFLKRGLMGQTQLGRVRAQRNLTQLWANESDHDPDAPGIQSRSDVGDRRLLFPSFVDGTVPAKMRKLSAEERERIFRQTGENMDQALVMGIANPTLQGLAMFTETGAITMALGLAYAEMALDATPLGDDKTTFVTPSDWRQRLLDIMVNYVGLGTEEVLEVIESVSNRDDEGRKSITEGEAAALESMMLGHLVDRTSVEGEVRANALGMTLLRMAPFVGPQVLDVHKAWYDSTDHEDPKSVRAWKTTKRLFGVTRDYYGSSKKERQRRAEDMGHELDKVRKGVE